MCRFFVTVAQASCSPPVLASSIAETLAIFSPFCSHSDSLLGVISLTGTSSLRFTMACTTMTGMRSVVASNNQELPVDESPGAGNLKKSLESANERVRQTTASAHKQQKQL